MGKEWIVPDEELGCDGAYFSYTKVVRCKDCYYCVEEKSFGKTHYYCDAFFEHADGDLIGVGLEVQPDHFCSWGERREDGKAD